MPNRYLKIAEMPTAQIDRLRRMMRVINNINDLYYKNLLITDETGFIRVESTAKSSRLETGWSTSLLKYSAADQHNNADRFAVEEEKRYADLNVIDTTITLHFNKLSAEERCILIDRYLYIKGRERIDLSYLSRCTFFRKKQYAEQHLIIEWEFDRCGEDGLWRDWSFEEERKLFFEKGIIPRRK